MKKLVLFDIDGTILNAGGIGRGAIYQSIEEISGEVGVSPRELRQVRMSGKTDTQIVHEILEDSLPASVIQNMLPRIFDRLTELLSVACQQNAHIKLLDGVPELIAAVTDHEMCVPGLLTGNSRRSAAVKLDVFELNPFFQVGAFGDDAHYRSALVDIAVQRAVEETGHRFRGKDIVILGDTPNDIVCGQHLGVCAIAVATGRFTRDELLPYQPDYLFEDLSDTRRVVEAILS
jgi:phosphoglycolate phosphatase